MTVLSFYACMAVPRIQDKVRDRESVSLPGSTYAVIRDYWKSGLLVDKFVAELSWLTEFGRSYPQMKFWPSFQRFSSSWSCRSRHAMGMTHLFSQSLREDEAIRFHLEALELSISTRNMSGSVTV